MRRKYKNIPYIPLEWPRALLVAVTFYFITDYMIWRLGTFNDAVPIFSRILYVAEVFGVISILLNLFMVFRLSDREAPAAMPGRSVDVFIPTINEAIPVVRRTALTAMAMDYPHQTWILDDGRREEVKKLAEELGCGYIARPTNEHAKAGNLNYALARTTGEFIAVFDADHAPKKTFLSRTLGYFLDADVAFVQTPQDFYNLDSFQHRTKIAKGQIWTEQSTFFRVIQRGKDVWNAAFFCGSCAIVRRSSLNAIGGFATGTVTEDIHTSIRLHKAGFASVYHPESLAFGIAAPHAEPFLRQRIRWGQGAMQVWRKERLLFSTKLKLPQKICYLASVITYFDGWQKFLYYITPALVLITGLAPIETTTTDFILHFVPYFVFCLWMGEELSRGYTRTLMIEQYNMARFAVFCWATMGLFFKKLKFRVTPKKLTVASEQWLSIMPQYIIFMLNAMSIPFGLWMYLRGSFLNDFSFTANAIWASINIAIAAAVLKFTLDRVRFQRQDYRFAIPLVASFTGKDQQPMYGAVDDLSSSGMLLLTAKNTGFNLDQELQGRLHLPGETIPFRAKIRTLGVRQKHLAPYTAGCQLIWDSHAARNQLELFLYGSNLEWQVHHISERVPTLLEELLPKFANWRELDTLPAYANGYDTRHSMLYTPAGAPQTVEPGIVAMGADSDRALAMTFTPFNRGAMLDSQVFTRDGWQPLKGRITSENKIEYLSKPMYFYELERTKA